MNIMPQDLYQAFCRNVRDRLEQLGITQNELARRLKVDPSYISQILNGHRRPGIDSLQSFAKALSMDPADLIRQQLTKTA